MHSILRAIVGSICFLASSTHACAEGQRVYSYDERNQLVRIETTGDPSRTVVFTYDDNGNRSSKTVAGVTSDYRWSATRNLLLEVDRDGTWVARYTYDPEGRRISKELNREPNDEFVGYGYDADGHLIAELDVLGNVIARYEWLGNVPLSMSRGGQTYHYYVDALGTPIALVRADGAVVARYESDAFGNPMRTTGSIANPIRFTGYPVDDETGLYYAGARYYDSELGAFLSVDPAEPIPTEPISSNAYLYAYANPTRYVDPDGECGALAEGLPFTTAVCDVADGMLLGANPYTLKGKERIHEYRFAQARAIGRESVDALASAGRAFTDLSISGRERYYGGDWGASNRTNDRIDAAADYFGNLPVNLIDQFVDWQWKFAEARQSGDPEMMGEVTATPYAAAVGTLVPGGAFARATRLIPDVPNLPDGPSVRNLPDAPEVPIQHLERAVVQESPPRIPDLDPATSRIYSQTEARRLDGPNRGVVFVQETVPAARRGQDFEAGAAGAFSDAATQKRVVPAIRFDNPNKRGLNFARFDGYEDGGRTLVDRKTQLTTASKQIKDLRRVSEAMKQNPGFQLVYEFPTRAAADTAQRILTDRGIMNINVRVANR